MYEKIGAMQLVAMFCASAANTAEFAREFADAVDWYRQAAMFFADLGLSRGRWRRSRGASLYCGGGPGRWSETRSWRWQYRCCCSWRKFLGNSAITRRVRMPCFTPPSVS